MAMPKNLSTLARAPLQLVLARVVKVQLPAPVQRFAHGTIRRLLRELPLLGELLELSRVVIDRVTAEGVVSAPVSAAAVAAVPTSKPVARAATAVASAAQVNLGDDQRANGSPAVEVPALLDAQRAPSAEAAIAAVEALASSSDPRAHDGLLAILRNADGYFHPLVRVAALRALAEDRTEPVRAAIVAAIDSASAEVSLAAIAALAQHAPEQASAPIRRVVEDRSGYFAPEVRAAAERALQRLASSSPN
jgi:hypothetical protein